MARENERVPLSMGVSQPSISMGAVFLSYASEDSAAAERIATTLRAAGIEVWFDKSELRGGDAWDRMIHEQIQACALFMPIISANAHARVEGYFRLEWKLAVDRSHRMAPDQPFLMPVVIDDTRQNDTRIPDRFRELQWTRAPVGETTPAFVERLTQLLSPEAQAAQPAPVRQEFASAMAPTLSASGLSSWRSRRVFWAIGVVFAAALAYFLVDKFWMSKRTTAATSNASASSTTAREKSIAVLPFSDMSEKHDQEYFANGMAEEVTDLLARLTSVRVIGRTSSFQFSGKNEDLRSIGTKLGAAYLVEGSVRRSGNQIRVTAQLIDAQDGLHRWSDTYDREISDVLQVQDDIAASLARALQITVSDEFGSRQSVKSLDAYNEYLRALHALDAESRDSCEEAVAEFQKALELEPTFARAALGLASAYQILGENGWMSNAFELARRAADLAIRLDPKLGAAHARLANVRTMYDWDWSGAEQEIRKAMDLGAGIEGMMAAAHLAAARGEWEQAVHSFKTAIAIDPLNPELHGDLGYEVYLRSERFAEAESSLRRALEISPSFGTGRYFLGLALLFQGRLTEALATIQQETLDDGQLEGLAIVYHAMGRKAESDDAFKRAIGRNGRVWPSGIAEVYAYRGELNQAMDWLERAYSQKDEALYLIKNDRLLRNLEDDPRYKAFLRKMKLPE